MHTYTHMHSFMYINTNTLHTHIHRHMYTHKHTTYIQTQIQEPLFCFVFFTWIHLIIIYVVCRINVLYIYSPTSATFIMILYLSLKSHMYVLGSGILSKSHVCYRHGASKSVGKDKVQRKELRTTIWQREALWSETMDTVDLGKQYLP